MKLNPVSLEILKVDHWKLGQTIVEVFKLEDDTYIAFARPDVPEEFDIDLTGKGEHEDKDYAIDLAQVDLYKEFQESRVGPNRIDLIYRARPKKS